MTPPSPSASLSSPQGGIELKNATQVLEQEQPPEAVDAYQNPWHTIFDRSDMRRLGKKQEYRRVFGPLATFGFISMYLCTWEYILVSISGGLINGGFGGLVWEYIFTAFAFGSVVITMAEMTSMAPTSGGQYHWISEFSPPRYQKYLSYAAGWTSALGWLTGNASGYFILSTLVEALVEVYDPNWSFTNWQSTLVMIFFLIMTIYFNTWGARLLPMIEILSLVFHLAGFVITIVPLWILAPKNSASDVFGPVVNGGGWSNTGTAFLVGTITILFSNLGPDAAVHIAEEVKDAAVVIPWAMVVSYFLNAALGFAMMITMLFTVGSLEDAINASSPFQNSFTNTGSTGVNVALTLILALLIGAANITSLATTSREVWAFARDGGPPGHRWISKVHHDQNVPFNAVLTTSFLSFILCLIQLGSTVAFNIIISLNLIAFLGTYMVSIGCLLLKRFRHETLPPARFSLGRWGLPVNLFAFFYSLITLVFSCFPVSVPVDASTANWGPAIWGGVLFIALVSYLVQGRRDYKGPVVFVAGVRTEGMGLQTATYVSQFLSALPKDFLTVMAIQWTVALHRTLAYLQIVLLSGTRPSKTSFEHHPIVNSLKSDPVVQFMR